MGVTQDDIDDAEDGANAKEALIKLVLSRTGTGTEGLAGDVPPEPESPLALSTLASSRFMPHYDECIPPK